METNSSPSFKIILGSSSNARRKILAEMGYEFTLMTADIDEKSIRKEKPEELVMVLAQAKADAIISKIQTTHSKEKDAEPEPTIVIAADTLMETSQAEAIRPRLPVDDYVKDAEPTLLITSDQVVVYEGAVREKPSSKEEARQFLKDYSGGHAATVGSMLVTNLKTGFSKGEWDRVEIYFHEIPYEAIEKLDDGVGCQTKNSYCSKSDIKSIKVRLGAIKKKRNVVLKYLENNVAFLLKIGLDINVYGGLSFMAH